MPSSRRTKESHFLDGKVDEALRKALGLDVRDSAGDQSETFSQVIHKLREIADETFSFAVPVFPQPTALDSFVQKSMEAYPAIFRPCQEDIDLLQHLQRYAACYVAYRSGYFDDHANTTKISPDKKLTIKLNMGALAKQNASRGKERSSGEAAPTSNSGFAAIKTFLEGCQPPMPHLFDNFRHAGITGEVHLQGMARWGEAKLESYLMEGSIANTPLQVEALVQALKAKI